MLNLAATHASSPAVLERVSGTAGCALSYIQANSSYSMFAQILYATPSSANISGTPPSRVMSSNVLQISSTTAKCWHTSLPPKQCAQKPLLILGVCMLVGESLDSQVPLHYAWHAPLR